MLLRLPSDIDSQFQKAVSSAVAMPCSRYERRASEQYCLTVAEEYDANNEGWTVVSCKALCLPLGGEAGMGRMGGELEGKGLEVR